MRSSCAGSEPPRSANATARAGDRAHRADGRFLDRRSVRNLFGGKRGKQAAAPAANDDEPQATDDPFFKRKGNDAYVELTINLAQAVLGSKVRVRTPSGKKVTVTITPGTDPRSCSACRRWVRGRFGTRRPLYPSSCKHSEEPDR